MADNMSIDKKNPVKDDSEESMDSSPEAEPNNFNNTTNTAATTQDGQQPKRKGGRKPIYATSEERKQRNRQAQAAFRERRTEYIKQLEETIRVHEQNLHNLQAAHRHAADECLMLRYKNSLLERILLEKGIDVQAELRAKTGSPNLGPTHVPQNLVQPPPISRAILNRHHARRSTSSIAPKLEPGITSLPPPTHGAHAVSSVTSPKTRPTPSSHSNSPTATTSAFGASPAGSGSDHVTAASMRPAIPAAVAVAPPPMKPQPLPGHMPAMAGRVPRTLQQQPPPQLAHAAQPGHPMQGVGVSTASYYPTPSFQNHIEQLEQEYDAAADMMEDAGDPPDTPSGPGPYPGVPYAGDPQPMSLSSPTTTGPPMDAGAGTVTGTGGGHAAHGHYPSMTQLLDPALDWDPFGLSASMQFPSHFSFDTSNMR